MAAGGSQLPGTVYDQTQVIGEPKTWDAPGIALAAETAQQALDA